MVENVKGGSKLYTDGYRAYRPLAGLYEHAWVDHGHDEYVRGEVHTQTIEGFFSTIKNGLRGVFHGVSKEWLQSYLTSTSSGTTTGRDRTRSRCWLPSPRGLCTPRKLTGDGDGARREPQQPGC